MGDVISITDAQGNELVEYEYDEWGKVIITIAENQSDEVIANINPIRYRGYYYDTETGYYYLQSRYYDPSICRFINADMPNIIGGYKNESIRSNNCFAYCINDPINFVDVSGNYRTYYFCPKDVIYSAAKKYLNSKGYELSLAMFYHFLYGNGKKKHLMLKTE